MADKKNGVRYVPSKAELRSVTIILDTSPVNVRDLLTTLSNCAGENAKRMKADRTFDEWPARIADQEAVRDRLSQCSKDLYTDNRKNWSTT